MTVSPIFCDILPSTLQHEWNRLQIVSCRPNFQYGFEYMKAWTELLRQEWKPLLLQVKEGKKLKGIFPLMYRDEKRKGILPYRRVRFLGSTRTDFSTILAGPGDVAQVVAASLEWLFCGKFRWELMILDDLQEGNPAVKYIIEWLSGHNISFEQTEGKYYCISLDRPWDDVLADTSKKFVKRNINLAQNRANKAGKWEFVADTDWNCDRIITEAAPMHIERQKDLNRGSFYFESAEKEFIKCVIEKSGPSGLFQSFWLLLANRPIAYMFGFEQDSVFYAWNMAFDPEHAKLFPSKLLLFELVKYCHKKKLKEFHFMRGESDYKSKWTKTYRINYRFTIHNTSSIYGKLSAFGDRLLR